MTRYCIWCGAEFGDTNSFCTACGKPVEVSTATFFETEVAGISNEASVKFEFPVEDKAPVAVPSKSCSQDATRLSPPQGKPIAVDFPASNQAGPQSQGEKYVDFTFPSEDANSTPAVQKQKETPSCFEQQPAIDACSATDAFAGAEGTTVLSEDSLIEVNSVADIFAGAEGTTVLPEEPSKEDVSEVEQTSGLSEDEEETATTILTQSPDEEDEATSVLVETRYYLVREKNEEKIQITLPCVVGRGRDADYKIKGNLAVSRTHVRISKENGAYIVEDLSSKNSTFVDDIVLPAAGKSEIKSGGRIKLGDEQFVFVVEG